MKEIPTDSLFYSFAEAAEVSIVIIDRDQKIRFWNKNAVNMFGYSLDEALNSNVAELIIPPTVMSSTKHQEYINRFFSGRPSRTFGSEATLTAITKSGDLIPIEITVFKLLDDSQDFVGAIVRNVSDKAQRIDQLNKKNDQINRVLGQLKQANSQLKIEKDTATYRLSRAQTQDKLALSMLFSVVSIVAIVITTSTFTRIQESVVNFSKDAALLIIGNLGGAVSALYGIRKLDENSNYTSTKQDDSNNFEE